MKKISVVDLYAALDEAKAVIIDHDALCYPCMNGLTEEPDNEFAMFSWDDGEWLDYGFKLTEESCKDAYIDDNYNIHTLDSEGNETVITLLVTYNGDNF